MMTIDEVRTSDASYLISLTLNEVVSEVESRTPARREQWFVKPVASAKDTLQKHLAGAAKRGFKPDPSYAKKLADAEAKLVAYDAETDRLNALWQACQDRMQELFNASNS